MGVRPLVCKKIAIPTVTAGPIGPAKASKLIGRQMDALKEFFPNIRIVLRHLQN